LLHAYVKLVDLGSEVNRNSRSNLYQLGIRLVDDFVEVVKLHVLAVFDVPCTDMANFQGILITGHFNSARHPRPAGTTRPIMSWPFKGNGHHPELWVKEDLLYIEPIIVNKVVDLPELAWVLCYSHDKPPATAMPSAKAAALDSGRALIMRAFYARQA
jgi:hypothetical protein